ncbi:baseplate assembly protein [Kibdelosporangium aridum]|uniref:Baseplate assembly protein n=1 Tax=Kibdelosporangium aridum TaxID=2030 RepID=A0A428YSQ4_KIBAR|nr:phage baseplate assembly protein V [Kibdelosporangium aridum]RSM72383.1 baseplate assembly protein [Kibdelosporangium aridum]
MPEPNRYLGKYRGTVVNNVDPMRQGRIQVRVPDVLGDATSSWAMPCFPVTGPNMGVYTVPPIGAGVWVEFEQGDVSFPIWVGCWYGSAAEVPAEGLLGDPARPNFVVVTRGQHKLVMSDLPGGPGITLRASSGASIVINDMGIEISNGQGAVISLTGQTVTINEGAFSIT